MSTKNFLQSWKES